MQNFTHYNLSCHCQYYALMSIWNNNYKEQYNKCVLFIEKKKKIPESIVRMY